MSYKQDFVFDSNEQWPKLISFVKESARGSDSRPSLTPHNQQSEKKTLAILWDDLSCPSVESDLEEESNLKDSKSDPFLLPAEELGEIKRSEISQDDSAINDPA